MTCSACREWLWRKALESRHGGAHAGNCSLTDTRLPPMPDLGFGGRLRPVSKIVPIILTSATTVVLV